MFLLSANRVELEVHCDATEIFAPLQVVPVSESILKIHGLFPTVLLHHLHLGKMSSF